uniref:ComEA family DNA-binding protein n=1 Tax=Candidatus Electronema sp. TaxID=2698783 RepID=UPI0040559D76
MSKRVLILLLLAALILAAGWQAPLSDAGSSTYFWADGRLIRSQGSRAGQGIRLDAGTACADTPPELSAFFNLPLPVNRAGPPECLRYKHSRVYVTNTLVFMLQTRECLHNDHSQAALMRLPGIGPKLAASIITYREEQGGFAGPDDLLKVKGIGAKRLANLTPLLCFD